MSTKVVKTHVVEFRISLTLAHHVTWHNLLIEAYHQVLYLAHVC